MDQLAATPCPDCAVRADDTDNYCRNCGMYLAAVRNTALMPAGGTRAVAHPALPRVPSPVAKVATVVTLGAALQVGLGIASKLIAAQANAPRAKPKRSVRAIVPAVDAAPDMPDGDVVSETLIYRRLWIKRG